MNDTILFSDATTSAVTKILQITKSSDIPLVVIRDMAGRIRAAINQARSEADPNAITELTNIIRGLGAYAASTGSEVLFKDDLFDPDIVFENPDILDFCLNPNDPPIPMLDRTVVGQDWLKSDDRLKDGAPRIVFYGIKGGVGRSTAMAIAAYDLAKLGRRVLAIDMDLESPGLSGLLLPINRLPDYGLVDWFVEDGVGQGEEVADRLTGISPISNETIGEIRVSSAIGSNKTDYVSKLSRVYGDVANKEGSIRFADRAKMIVKRLNEKYQPDVILIDSRAGMHDLAAISIVSLSDSALLFASDTDSTWLGYKMLFAHWQKFPAVARVVRERLKMTQALFPEINQSIRARRFIERSYDLFLDTLYDEDEPYDPSLFDNEDYDGDDDFIINEDINSAIEPFTFDLEDSEAPHYPMRIKWNNRFQEFDMSLITEGVISEADIESTYGDFLGGVQLLAERN